VIRITPGFLAPDGYLGRLARRLATVAFGLAFVAGLALVWIGLDALVLGGGDAGRGLPALGLGFLTWVVLSLVAGGRRR
jgi:hypothetical protein